MVSLRNLQKVVSASSFAAKTHNYLFASYGRNFSPASFYFTPQDENLQSGHSHDPFTLALLASELTRENRNLTQFLESLPVDSKQEALQNDLISNIQENKAFIKSYTKELALQLKSQTFNFPVETCSHAIYAFEHNNESQKDLYQQILFPIIKEKLNFMSFEGLAKLISGLVQAQSFEDKNLLNSVLGRLREKAHQREGRQFVGFNAWKLDRYELMEKKNEVQGTVQDLKEKHSGSVGALKHWLRVNWAFLQNNLLFRVFYRETRIHRQFDEASDVEVVKGLIGDLQKLVQLEPNVNVKDLFELLKKEKQVKESN